VRSRAAGDAQGWEAHLADFDDDGQDSLPPLGVPRYLLAAPFALHPSDGERRGHRAYVAERDMGRDTGCWRMTVTTGPVTGR